MGCVAPTQHHFSCRRYRQRSTGSDCAKSGAWLTVGSVAHGVLHAVGGIAAGGGREGGTKNQMVAAGPLNAAGFRLWPWLPTACSIQPMWSCLGAACSSGPPASLPRAGPDLCQQTRPPDCTLDRIDALLGLVHQGLVLQGAGQRGAGGSRGLAAAGPSCRCVHAREELSGRWHLASWQSENVKAGGSG